MINLLRSYNADSFHLPDGVLILALNQELSWAATLLAKKHLRNCFICRERFEQLERAAHKIIEHRQNLIRQHQPLSSARRELFIRQLDLLYQSMPARPLWKRLPSRFRVRPFGSVVPSFASVAFLVCAVLILLSFWHWKLSTVSASEFLARAVASDGDSIKIADSKVICQRLHIKTARKTFDHAVYRDSSGLRHPKNVKIDAEEADLAARLALAGVNWEDPLSATSFKNWHDRQRNPIDDVHSSGEGLLTISTRVPTTNAAQESLTVAENGFRPVERIIEYRDFGTVDISEAGREPLSSEMAAQLFLEIQPAKAAAHPDVSARALFPNRAQLDEAELLARLVLNQENADTGEQIEIRRDVKGVQVKGVVDSEEREQGLRESLHGIPFLAIAIRKFGDFKPTPIPTKQNTVVEESAVAQVSPFEKYFEHHGRSRDDLSRISAGLFNYSLAINRSSRAIEEILLRFCNNEELSPIAIESRDALLVRNTARLLDALREQERLEHEAGVTLEVKSNASEAPDAPASQLAALAERNTIATRDLISGDSESPRPIESIAAELAETISLLRTVALQPHPRCSAHGNTGKP